MSNKNDSAGVYKINCNDCSSMYIGQTGRSFKIRYKEHRPDPKLQKRKSSFAQHLIDKNHTMGNIDDSLDVLHICKKSRKLDTLEEFEIYKHFQNTSMNDILNEKLHFSSHSIFNAIIGHRTRPPADQTTSDNGMSDDRSGVT